MKRVLFCLGLSISFIGCLQAQQNVAAEQEYTTTDHIKALSENTLLVRLPSNRKKIQAIKTSLDNDALSEKGRSRLALMLEETELETAEMQERYTEAFKAEYSFSKVGFFFDYDTPGVLEGWGKVYHGDLQTEMTVPSDRPWYVLSIGRTPDSRLEGLVVLDYQLNPVPRPFPNNVLTSGMAAIGAWFHSGPSEHFFVRKLQKNLKKFFERQR